MKFDLEAEIFILQIALRVQILFYCLIRFQKKKGISRALIYRVNEYQKFLNFEDHLSASSIIYFPVSMPQFHFSTEFLFQLTFQ